MLCGAIAGACIAYSMIYFCNVFDWPLNIGNRPPHGPPANIPITFELAVLLGGGSAFMGFFALAKLPQPYHPIFESEEFARASIDAFFLSVELPAGTDMDRALADIRASGALSARDRRGVGAMTARLASFTLARRRCSRSRLRPASTRTSSTRWPTASRKANRYRESKFYADGLTHAGAARGHGPARAHHAEPAR